MNISYSTNPIKTLSTCNLVAAYNTCADYHFKNATVPDENIQYCLIVTVEGCGTVLLKDRSKMHLNAKTIFFGNINNMNTLLGACDNWHFYCYWFTTIGIDIPTDIVIKDKNINQELENEFSNKIISLLKNATQESVRYANALFTCKVLELQQLIPKSTSTSYQTFCKIIAYINTNIHLTPKIQEIAQHLNYSPKHLREIFKKYAKTTPKNYIIKRKLEHIAILLKTTSYSLDELTEQFDFYNSSHLIYCFKKEYGVTPNIYKNTPYKNKKHK